MSLCCNHHDHHHHEAMKSRRRIKQIQVESCNKKQQHEQQQGKSRRSLKISRFMLLVVVVVVLSMILPIIECREEDAQKNKKKNNINNNNNNKNSNKNNNNDKENAITQVREEEEEEEEEEKEEANHNNNNNETTTESSSSSSSSSSSQLPTFNATAFSIGACEKVDFAVDYITSLDFDKTFVMNVTTAVPESVKTDEFRDVFWLQCILTPLSLGMVFFGSNLLLPTCILASVALGIFVVFHLIDNYIRGGLDCQMKLAGSVVMASLAAMTATSFVRFGLFSLGAFAAGGGTYLLFDAFPILDRGAEMVGIDVTTQSDLTAFAWVVTILLGICGGLLIRWYEQASLEIVTAILGGIGCAYSIHTFVIIKGGQLQRSVVFLIACFISFIGWRFQRRRRLWRETMYHPKRNEDATYATTVVTAAGSPTAAAAAVTLPHHQVPPQQSWQIMPVATTSTTPTTQQQQTSPPSWQQLQSMIQYAQQPPPPPPQQQQQQIAPLIQQQQQNTGPTSEQIVELTKTINLYMESVASNRKKEKEVDSAEKES